MKDNAQTSHEESIQNTSQSSSSGTTGPGSFLILNFREEEMIANGNHLNTGSSVGQGADNLEPPQAPTRPVTYSRGEVMSLNCQAQEWLVVR